MSGISETLNIKSLEEAMAEHGITEDETTDASIVVDTTQQELMNKAEMTNHIHTKKMKEVYDEAMDVARKCSDLGMNIDPKSSPAIFEVMAKHLKIAIDASSSQRESELKLMKIIQDQKKLEMDEKRLMMELGEVEDNSNVIMVADRNAILARHRANKDNKDK